MLSHAEKRKIKRNITAHLLLTASVTLIFIFVNIYQSFRPITILKRKLITNQCVAKNCCLVISVTNTSVLLRCVFILCVFKTKTLRKIQLWLSFSIKRVRKLFSLKKSLFIQVNIGTKGTTKFCYRLYMKVNLPIEFNREKFHLSCKYHIYIIKTMT